MDGQRRWVEVGGGGWMAHVGGWRWVNGTLRKVEVGKWPKKVGGGGRKGGEGRGGKQASRQAGPCIFPP